MLQIKVFGPTPPCANCKRQIMQLIEHYDTGVKVGGVFDLLMHAAVLD